MIRLYVHVTTTIRGLSVRELGGKLATYEGTQFLMHDTKKAADRLVALYRTDGITVGVDLEEKISGPQNTYSSVAVRVSITARCAQSEDSVRRMVKALHDEATKALSHYMPPSLELLRAHVDG